MQVTTKSAYAFGDLAQEAGLGSFVWGRASYLAGRYYHYIVALFTAAILLLVLPERTPWQFAFAAIALYVAYVILRKLIVRSEETEQAFYWGDKNWVKSLRVVPIFVPPRLGR